MKEVGDWLRAELFRRADAEDPEECCGLISEHGPTAGLPDGGVSLWAAENVAPDPSAAFEIRAMDLQAILNQIVDRGEKLVGVYHSHPHGPITPSPEDIRFASGWPGLTWVIVGRSVCGGCRGKGEVPGPRPEGAPAAATVRCEGCEGAGTVPDMWRGVLA